MTNYETCEHTGYLEFRKINTTHGSGHGPHYIDANYTNTHELKKLADKK